MLTFNSTHVAMEFENILKNQCSVIVMPTLREITTGCGISIKIKEQEYEKALSAISSSKIPDSAEYSIYSIEGLGKNKVIKQVKSI
ncbi:MAG: DUF3343 domain-containing protein [Oscillospiraceae bacterium]